MRSTLLLIAAAALGCTLAAPAPMFAQVSELPPDVLAEEAPYRLVYDHVTATFRLLRPNGSQVAGWEASGQRALAPVPPDRPLEVVIENANTLLYTYEVTAEPVQGGRQVRACRDVGREALSTGFFVGSRSFAGGATAFPSLAGTLEQVQEAREEAEEGSPFGFADSNSASALMEQARSQVQEYQNLLASATRMATNLEQTVIEIAMMADVRPIGVLVDSALAQLDAVQSGLGNPRLAPAVLASQRGRAQSTLSAVASMAPGEFGPSAQMLSSTLSASVDRERGIAAELQESLLRLARARAASMQTVTALPSGGHRQVTISIVDNEEELPVRRTRTGRAVAFTRPAVAMVCEISFGLAWMEPPAQYRLGSGSTVVDATSNDDVRTSASLMLHISPSAIPALGVMGGLGIGSGTAPDLYLGGTLRLFRPLMLNGGMVWQRQALLPGGVSVGDVVDDPSMFDDLERGYRPTMFFGVSFAR